MKLSEKRALQKKRQQQQRSAAIVIGAALIIIIVSVVTARHHTSADNKANDAKKTTTTQNGTNQAKPTTDKTKSSNTSSTQSDADRQASSGASTPGATAGPAAPDTALVAPSGNFVSTHRSSVQNTITSVCTTTPGASCALVFTNGATTKELSTQPTDVHGSAHWAWQATTIDLGPGNWTVIARATLGDQVKETTDPQPLVITN